MGPTSRRTDAPGGDAGVTRLTNLDLEAGAVITIDGDRRILSLSRHAERILGYRAVEVLGEPLDRLLPGRFVEGGHDGEEVVGGRRTPAEARRLALEINDDVVQCLVVAQSALALGWDPERVREAVDQALATVRRLVTALLGDGPVESGDLVRGGSLRLAPEGSEPRALGAKGPSACGWTGGCTDVSERSERTNGHRPSAAGGAHWCAVTDSTVDCTVHAYEVHQ